MTTNRRTFLKTAGVAGASVVVLPLSSCDSKGQQSNLSEIKNAAEKSYTQQFNMCGFSAPPLEKVRVGFIGLGDRGCGAVTRMIRIEGVEVTALCDLRQAAVDHSQRDLQQFGLPRAQEYAGDENAWKRLCEQDDIDLIYICSPWEWHTPQSVYAMEQGKHVAVEIPAAKTIDEAWQLVETSERTRKHCMMLENCCYDFFELLTLNMARQGLFGDIVHGEGAYIHNLMGYNFRKPDDRQRDGAYTGMWRLHENSARNGSLYPTHGLGPVAQIMNINRGDKFDYLTSMSTNDFGMQEMANKLAAEDDFYSEFAGRSYRGNMNSTVLRTISGKTVLVQHDVTTVRPYSRIHMISGTLGIARKYPSPAKIAFGHSWLSDERMKSINKEYTPELVRKVGDMARRVGGHGGMDFIMDWRLIDCLRNGLPVDQDVYDAALWSAVSPLSEWSVANRSAPIDIPDFTCGSWKSNKPHEINLERGGTTAVLEIREGEAPRQMKIY